MRFVAEHTAILVPKVYSAFEHKAKVYIVMERIDGVDLAYGWYQRNARVAKPHPREPSRHDLAVAPDTSSRRACGVSNVDGGPIYDRRLPGNGLWGPFLTIHDFHRELRGGVDEPEFEGTAILELEPLIAFQKTSHGRILSSRTVTLASSIFRLAAMRSLASSTGKRRRRCHRIGSIRRPGTRTPRTSSGGKR